MCHMVIQILVVAQPLIQFIQYLIQLVEGDGMHSLLFY
ncbi:MAG: hypothetical protein K0S80_3874 [Neobacillus sp.]|nr:hypothetical protein [Neobacillus sp.]